MQKPSTVLPFTDHLFALGFRPFFLGAITFAVMAMAVWLAVYTFGATIPLNMPALSWHAHEMIYGYGTAVVAGFLLTAVRNWTGVDTPTGLPLALIFGCWLGARLLAFVGASWSLPLMIVFDNAFMLCLVITYSIPVARAHSHHNWPIAIKLLLLLLSNDLYYAGLFGKISNGTTLGLYSGLYLLLALVFTIGRRVMPFFIERGVGLSNGSLTNRRWVDLSSMVTFLLFWLADLLANGSYSVAALAAILCVLHGLRLCDWYHPGIWRKPLLWVLYLAYALVVAGFALKTASVIFPLTPNLATHALAMGGIGIMTAGMMARITLGHTGRDVYSPPQSLTAIFSLLVLASLCRVLLPLTLPTHYLLWISLSQCMWIAAFLWLFIVYAPMLTAARADGQPG